jgi:hypothetical protein
MSTSASAMAKASRHQQQRDNGEKHGIMRRWRRRLWRRNGVAESAENTAKAGSAPAAWYHGIA